MNLKCCIIIFIVIGFSRDYIFTDNYKITNSENDQRYPEVKIKDDIIHLTWVSMNGNNKNIMYSKSEDNGNSFSEPIQVNLLDNHIVAYSQSGPKIDSYANKVFISYMDDRNGLWSIYMNASYDFGETWQEEELISDTDFSNGYQDFKIDSNGDLHLIYYNYDSNYHLDDVRYRFSNSDNFFNPSFPVGIVTDEMEPCDCCQPKLEIDINNDIYIAYRNNNQSFRDTYLAIKRQNENLFNEYYQISDYNDFIDYCPSSGPAFKINEDEIAVAFSVYNNQNIYSSISTIDDLSFNNFINVNPDFNSFQNYPYAALDDDLFLVWVDFDGWDVYYGRLDIESNSMLNIQKVNNDLTDAIQHDPIIHKYNESLYIFWSDKRDAEFQIYFSKSIDSEFQLGDINQDSLIDILDIISIVNIIFINEYNFLADINSDSIINVLDIIAIVNIILN